MDSSKVSKKARWAEFRFSVVGRLLSSPPERGELQGILEALAGRHWKHPMTGEPTTYGKSTIERWYYQCLKEQKSPITVLRRKIRHDKGTYKKIDARVKELIANQYRSHPSWSYKLHADNIKSSLRKAGVSEQPSYSTLRRYMQSVGSFKQKKVRPGQKNRAGYERALNRRAKKEIRSYEVEHVGGLWHLDFHHCSLQILMSDGSWQTPICLAVIDDRSRLACHVQWYLAEDTRCLVHGFSQSIQKRGIPRALMSDNGSAMLSTEFTSGLMHLSIVHETTLPYSPYQNGKQERFFGIVEGRLIAMLENCENLTLKELNLATTAWVEREYNRTVHEELGMTPLQCYLESKDVSRRSPSSSELRLCFRREVRRRQRRTDGTVSIEGKRFEVPARYGHLRELHVRYAKWDLGTIHLVCPDNGTLLCPLYPLDKTAHASGKRKHIQQSAESPSKSTGMAPLLEELIAEYAATGLPPAYIPEESE